VVFGLCLVVVAGKNKQIKVKIRNSLFGNKAIKPLKKN
jgi:hypothetical protein